MEESDLMRARLQALTEKHHLHENIRQKKQTLDREKLCLQHLKKKVLREQWLHGEVNEDETKASEQQKRALQVKIHRMEMDVLSLERSESVVSTNESFILEHLRDLQKASRDPLPELSADEVEQLLRSSSVHRQGQNLTGQTPSGREDLHFYDGQRKAERRRGLRNQEGFLGDRLFEKMVAEKDYSRQIQHPQKQGRQDADIWREPTEGNRHGNQRNVHHRNHHVVMKDQCPLPVINSITRSNSHVIRDNGCRPPRSHDQEVIPLYQSQLCYTPANQIPLRDYISVEEEKLYFSHQPTNHLTTALYRGSSHSDRGSTYSGRGSTHSTRGSSPLYQDNALYTILNAINASDPITAINTNDPITAINTSDLITSINTSDLITSINTSDPITSINTSDLITSINTSDPITSINTSDPITSLNTSDPITAINNTNQIMSINTSDQITAIFMGFQLARDDGEPAFRIDSSLKAELVIVEDNQDDYHSNKNKESIHAHKEGCIHLTGSSANGNAKPTLRRSDIRNIHKRNRHCCTVC